MMCEFDFNVNNKKGTASRKVLEEIKQNRKNYDRIKDRLILEANSEVGTDVLTDYGVSENFDYSSLNPRDLKGRCLQKIFIPFSNEQIKKFIE